MKYVKTYDFIKWQEFYIRRHKERPVNSNITSRIDISSTRVSCILVQSPLYSPSFSNCSPLSIDTRRFTILLSLWPCTPWPTYFVFWSFARNLLIPGVEWIALQRLWKTFVSLELSPLYKVELYKDPTSWILFEKKKRANSFSKRFLNQKKKITLTTNNNYKQSVWRSIERETKKKREII